MQNVLRNSHQLRYICKWLREWGLRIYDNWKVAGKRNASSQYWKAHLGNSLMTAFRGSHLEWPPMICNPSMVWVCQCGGLRHATQRAWVSSLLCFAVGPTCVSSAARPLFGCCYVVIDLFPGQTSKRHERGCKKSVAARRRWRALLDFQ